LTVLDVPNITANSGEVILGEDFPGASVPIGYKVGMDAYDYKYLGKL
jgi:hypothetical protein